MRQFITLSFLVINLPFWAFAQEDNTYIRYSADHVKTFNLSSFYENPTPLNPIDSALSDIYQDFPAQYNFYNSLGNIGLAGQVLDESHWRNFGYNSGYKFVDSYLFSLPDNKYFQTKIPYVNIAYLNGPRKYQRIDLIFTENVNSQMNFAVKFNRFSSEGYYQNQKSIFSNFELQTNFLTKNGRYGYLASWFIDIVSIRENGGIRDVDDFPNVIDNSKISVPVYLSRATNTIDKRIFYLNQFYRFGKRVSDSSYTYSSTIFLDSRYLMNRYSFNDYLPDTAYYSRYFPVDSNTKVIEDLSKDYVLSNVLGYRYTAVSGLSVQVGAKIDYITTVGYNFLYDTSFVDVMLMADFPRYEYKRFVFEGLYHHIVSGFYEGGYKARIHFGRLFFGEDNVEVYIAGEVENSLPSYKYIKYSSSTISWLNALNNQLYRNVEIGVSSLPLGMRLFGRLYDYSNFTYFKADGTPGQFGYFNGWNITLKKKFSVKPVYFDVKVMYQDVPGDAPIRVPQWAGFLSVYYQNYLFKGALEWKAGFDFYINTKYKANGYLPLTRSFVFQDQYDVGEYPFLTVFLMARIKRAQGYVKFLNLGQGLFGDNYMMVPGYPMQDRGFYFGIRWDFMN